MKINPQTILVRDLPPLLNGAFVFGQTYETWTDKDVMVGDPVTIDALLLLIDDKRTEVVVFPAF